jgi:hypothetical protein
MREIEADKYHEIHLNTVGIPAEATVLQVGYTPQGGEGGAVFPIELHGNVPQRRIVRNVLRLLGRAMLSGDGTLGSVCPVSIWVVWVHQEKEDAWPYVVSAFEAFIDRHYDRVIVPAQSAVEIGLMPVVRELLERHASAEGLSWLSGLCNNSKQQESRASGDGAFMNASQPIADRGAEPLSPSPFTSQKTLP